MARKKKPKNHLYHFAYFKSLWGEIPLLGWILAIWTGGGIVISILPKPTRDSLLKVINMIPHLPVWWFMGLLIITILWLFEASFRRTRDLTTGFTREKERLNEKITKLSDEYDGAFQLLKIIDVEKTEIPKIDKKTNEQILYWRIRFRFLFTNICSRQIKYKITNFQINKSQHLNTNICGGIIAGNSGTDTYYSRYIDLATGRLNKFYAYKLTLQVKYGHPRSLVKKDNIIGRIELTTDNWQAKFIREN